jgi:hypothetical protein
VTLKAVRLKIRLRNSLPRRSTSTQLRWQIRRRKCLTFWTNTTRPRWDRIFNLLTWATQLKTSTFSWRTVSLNLWHLVREVSLAVAVVS